MTTSLLAERQTLEQSLLLPTHPLTLTPSRRTGAATYAAPTSTSVHQASGVPLAAAAQELDPLGQQWPTWSPVDAWLRLEDICWRLRHQGLRVTLVGRAIQILGFRGAELPADLQRAVLDTDTYAWTVGQERGAVVCTLDYEGLDLVLTLPTEQQLDRVPEGHTVIQLRAAFSIALVRRGLQ